MAFFNGAAILLHPDLLHTHPHFKIKNAPYRGGISRFWSLKKMCVECGVWCFLTQTHIQYYFLSPHQQAAVVVVVVVPQRTTYYTVVQQLQYGGGARRGCMHHHSSSSSRSSHPPPPAAATRSTQWHHAGHTPPPRAQASGAKIEVVLASIMSICMQPHIVANGDGCLRSKFLARRESSILLIANTGGRTGAPGRPPPQQQGVGWSLKN